MRTRTIAILFLSLSTLAIPARAQTAPPPRAEVLVLGVYHMNNPGRDLFNTKADDVLAPQRQAEIAQVVEVLKKFRPTKIAVERDTNDSRVKKAYADYLAGTRELTRDETEQLGFRLAKELGHATIYPVDIEGEFPIMRVMKFAKATGREKELDAITGRIGEMVKERNAFLASHSVLDALLALNSDESVARELGYYYQQGAYGEPWDWAGADFLAEWYRRNMRIYSNTMQIIDSPNDRVLLIFGSGHLGWLRLPFSANPDVRLRKLAEFVK